VPGAATHPPIGMTAHHRRRMCAFAWTVLILERKPVNVIRSGAEGSGLSVDR
jgi:hypothetical protein